MMNYEVPEMEVVAVSADTAVAYGDVEEDFGSMISKNP